MKQAIIEAKKTKGFHLPNPPVGAIIVKDNKIIGSGYHAKFGFAHAEINAMKNAKKNGHSVENADIYITLQPCSKHGQTGACLNEIIKNKFKKVIIGSIDKSDKDSIKLLRQKGIEVELIEDTTETDELIKIFNWNIESNKPYVYGKIAISKDGYSATNTKQQWITSKASRNNGRILRTKVQAILVGSRTIINDNPLLNSRIEGYRNPDIIIIDPKLKISKKTNIFKSNVKKYIFINENTKISKYPNTEFIKLKESKISTNTILDELYKRGIKSILVEGGMNTLKTFIIEKNINVLYKYQSNKNLIQNGINKFEDIKLLSSNIKYKKVDIENDTLKIYEVK